MKTLFTTLLMATLVLPSVHCKDNSPKPDSLPGANSVMQSSQAGDAWPTLTVGFNPAGFLFSGPSLHADVKLFKRTYLSGYFIYHSMGMLSEAMFFGDEPNEYGNNSWGFGAGFKQFFKPNSKNNAWYAGAYVGYSYNEATYNEGPPEEITEKMKDIVYAAGFGYRWNIGKRFSLTTGLIGGITYSNEDKVYSAYVYDFETMAYSSEERLIQDFSGEIYPYLIVEITLGIQF